MRLVLFTTTLRNEDVREEHERMTREMREMAESTPGFVAWHDCVPVDDRTTTGVIVFESEESLAAWREDPRHHAAHQRGEEAVYGRFDVQIFEQVRENRWAWPGLAGAAAE